MKVGIVGSGLAAASAAHRLHNAGCEVEITEAAPVWGGQLRLAEADGILYEPHGAHIFHTADTEVWELVTSMVTMRPYVHVVMTEVHGRIMSWPPQVEELKELPEWPAISAELDARPAEPDPANFESWCVGIMGRTLYEWFIEPYTRKQWGTEPNLLSSRFAPKRVDLRTDGYRGLFRDPHQGWPEGGYTKLVDCLLRALPVTMGIEVTAENFDEWRRPYDKVLVTAPLDAFFRDALGPLPWRGVKLVNRYYPGVDHVLPCGVLNHPGMDKLYTRRVETKWMSGQERAGTVVSEEYPGHPARHYPIDDAAGANKALAAKYQELLRTEGGPDVFIAGRLATYTYIDMDQAVRQGLNAASAILRA